mgnify:CR=1 FL=1
MSVPLARDVGLDDTGERARPAPSKAEPRGVGVLHNQPMSAVADPLHGLTVLERGGLPYHHTLTPAAPGVSGEPGAGAWQGVPALNN